jgi:DNA-binding XRE family transcriptional regulator
VSNEAELQFQQNTSTVIRAARKRLGFSQTEMARKIGQSKATYFRIEAGESTFNMFEWHEFCELTKIPSDSWTRGLIDFNRSPQEIRLEDGPHDGTFLLPERFSRFRGSMVRSIQLQLNYFRKYLGQERLNEFIKSRGIDPDFFVLCDHQINIQFLWDLMFELIEARVLDEDSLQRLCLPVAQPLTHGKYHSHYDGVRLSSELIVKLISSSPRYDVNYRYSIIDSGPKVMDLEVQEHEHLDAFQLDPMLAKFMCAYRRSYIESFSSYGGHNALKFHELECAYDGGDRCIFRVPIA